MRPFRVLIVMVAVLVAGSAIPAQADPIKVSFGFVASDFGDGAPVDPVIGSFTLSFDNSVNHFDETAGLTLARINIALAQPVGFDYSAELDSISFGSVLDQVSTVGTSTDDFSLAIAGISTAQPRIIHFLYSQTGAKTFVARAAELTAAPTPEPGTFVLLLTGGALALLRWRATAGC
jgi:hypothetical protein